MQDQTIAIVGGGFAGTTLAQSLEHSLPDGWQIVLISEESYTTFNPMLAEVVGAAVFPEHVIAPIRQMLTRTRFVMGRMTGLDAARRRVLCTTLTGATEIGYTHLVLAFGLRANLNLIPGMAEHGLPLKLVGDAMHIRNRVLQRMAAIELTVEPARRRSLGHFVVVGGGFSGVEVAGALADFLHGARRYYPRVQVDELRVTLLHDGDRLLPELPAPLGAAAARSLMQRRVQVKLGARAVRVSSEGAELADGSWLDSATVVCTIGTRPHAVLEQLGLPTTRGRISTDEDMSVHGHPGLWALGDCAAVPNAAPNAALNAAPTAAVAAPAATTISPPTAQFAVAQARQLAANLLAYIEGRRTHPFAYRSKGMMATTGHQKGVAQAWGVRLTGLPAWLMWRAYYLMRMPTLGRKVRIWVEWTWSLFFPADITHLRFTRTAESESAAEVPLPATPQSPPEPVPVAPAASMAR